MINIDGPIFEKGDNQSFTNCTRLDIILRENDNLYDTWNYIYYFSL